MTLERYVFDVYFKMADIAPSTMESYRRVLVGLVFPHLGNKKVCDITRKDVTRLLQTLKVEGKTAGNIGRAKRILSAVLSPLVADEDLNANPVFGARVPKTPKQPRRVLVPSEVKALITQVTDVQGLFIKLLVDTGARFGEGSELRPLDFNFQTKVLTISRNASDVGGTATGRFLVKTTKSGNYRPVPFSAALSALLLEHIQQHGIGQGDLLFPQSLVAPVRRVLGHSDNQTDHLTREQWSRVWRAAVAAAGLAWRPVTHDLRHAYATWNLQAGRDLKTVSARLGHHSIVVTQIYTHAIAAENDPSAELVSSLLA